MNTFFIFGAKYLWAAAPLIALYAFYKSGRKKQMVWFGVFTLPLAYILAKVAGHFFYSPRPFVSENIAPLIQHAADNGFPSDHVLIASAIASLMLFFDRRIAIWLWIIAVLVAWSRVYVGVHHVIDVVGSMIISLIAAGVVYFLSKNKLDAAHDSSDTK